MKKELSPLKWFAIALLTTGSIINSHGALQAKSLDLSTLHVSLTGILLLTCYCFISGFSGVFSEYLLKKDMKLSVHYQNGLLYSFGVIFNFTLWFFQGVSSFLSDPNWAVFNMLHGFNIYTWILILSQAACGVIMSLIMKHLSNMVRVFVVSSAPLVTTVFAFFIFSLHIHYSFLASLTLVCVAIVMYNYWWHVIVVLY